MDWGTAAVGTRSRRAANARIIREELQRVGVSWVLRVLEDEGLAVTDVWYPEAAPSDPRMAGRTSHPECACRLNGRQAAIDLTRFSTDSRGASSTFALEVRDQIVAHLEAAHLPFGVLAGINYNHAALARVGRPGDRARDAAALASAILDIARRGPVQSAPLPAELLPAWVKSAGLTVSDTRPGHAEVHPRSVRDPAAHVAEALDRIVEGKGRQLAPWGLGIVAALNSHELTVDDVAAGLRARRDWPWWRFYWIGPEIAQLLWDRDAAVTPHA
jgi:hypothetical protein